MRKCVLILGLLGFTFACIDGEEVELWGECYIIDETTELNLYYSGLTGGIPSAIGQLVNLESIRLWSNMLTGEIPYEIGNLINLTELNLRSNQLTGEMPPEIGNLINLTELDLSYNELNEEIPSSIGNLINLHYLVLDNNQLYGDIPPEIGQLVNLEKLYLDENQITDEIPSEIGNLENLTFLGLSSNNLMEEIPPEIGNLENLTILQLSHNQLIGEIPPEIGNLISLETLYLKNNNLSGSIPSEIGDLENLEYLFLHDNQLGCKDFENGDCLELCDGTNGCNGDIPSEIGNLVNLDWLYLSNNQLNGVISESICDLDIIWSDDGIFRIFNNNFCPPYPECIEEYVGEQFIFDCDVDCDEGYVGLWGMCLSIEETTYLSLSVGLTGEIPPEIGQLINLIELDLNSNYLTGNIPSEIGNLVNLVALNLSNQDGEPTGGINEIPSEIGNLITLEYLNLSANNISIIPPEIGNLESLISLELSNNSINELPPEIGNLESLISLELSNNSINELPAEIGDLENLISLGLDDNSINELPPEIGNLITLEYLNLFYNNISIIPPEIGDLESLISLELTNNSINELPAEIGDLENLISLGLDDNSINELPPEIGNLITLEYLNLSYNDISIIPPEIGNLENLISLSLFRNKISELPESICDIYPNLADFTLEENQLCPPYPECITEEDIGYQDISCPELIYGCTDPEACNYNPDATEDDGNCEYAEENYDCDGNCIVELDCLGDCGGTEFDCGGGCDENVELWGECYNIEETTVLNLAGTGLIGVIPSDIGNLVNLTELYLSGNQLTGEIPVEIGNLVNLTKLFLYSNDLTGAIPIEIGNLVNLSFLHLHTNQLTGYIPEGIGNLNLYDLRLNSNQLSGEIPAEIGQLVNLSYLSLTSNELTGEIPAEIGQLVNLSYLGLASNELTGEIPVEICNVVSWTLSLSNNQFTGYIPDCLWEINRSYLYLSNNQLTGEIPSEIGELTNLTNLELHDNQLTGGIPSEIGELTNLTNLNLHDNQLSGLITENLCDINNVNVGENQLCPPYPECLSEEQIGYQDTSECIVLGCTDTEACNYNPEATEDDGSCEYAEENFDCDGNCIAELDCLGDCGGDAVVDECGVCDGPGAIYECGCEDIQKSLDISFSTLEYGNFNIHFNNLEYYSNEPDSSNNYTPSCGYIDTTLSIITLPDDSQLQFNHSPYDTSGSSMSYLMVQSENCDDIYNQITVIIVDDVDDVDDIIWIELHFSSYLIDDILFDIEDMFLFIFDLNEYIIDSFILEISLLDACDCDGTLPDCSGECYGDAIIDECDVCDGNNLDKDECGICFGDNSTCTGCTDPIAENYDEDNTIDDGSCFYQYTRDFHAGANLISFWALPEDNHISNVMESLGFCVSGVIGEGVAASRIESGTWVGSLTNITYYSGYWVKTDYDCDMAFIGTKGEELVYGLHSGANLISFPDPSIVAIGEAIPDDVEPLFEGIIAEGVAASNIGDGVWVGSLSAWEGSYGYWAKVTEDLVFSFELPDGLVRTPENTLAESPYEYTQSIYQAFYFIEEANLDGEPLEIGDWIIAYNKDIVVGARQWTGAYTDIPAMGYYDVSTAGYCEAGDIPRFVVEKGLTGEVYELDGTIPVWENNMLFYMTLQGSTVHVPTEFEVSVAYPNPFNPRTTVKYGLPVDNFVSIVVYDLSGKQVASLMNEQQTAGFHSVTWDAQNHSSGLYFVKLVTGDYQNTQKVMLVK